MLISTHQLSSNALVSSLSSTCSGVQGLCGLHFPLVLSQVSRHGRKLCSLIFFQVVGGETLAQLKRRVTACGFYSGPVRMEAMYGRLGLENANARVWDQMTMATAPQRLSFAPTRLDLADVEATPLRTRKARPCLTLTQECLSDSSSCAMQCACSQWYSCMGVAAAAIQAALEARVYHVYLGTVLGFQGRLLQIHFFLRCPDTAAASTYFQCCK